MRLAETALISGKFSCLSLFGDETQIQEKCGKGRNFFSIECNEYIDNTLFIK
jgi:hypothetical protein